MEYEEDWLNTQIDRSNRAVGLWPVYQQEYMSNEKFTPEQRIEKIKLRIQLLHDEIKMETIALDTLLRNGTP